MGDLAYRVETLNLGIAKRSRDFSESIWCHNGTMKRMNLRDVPDDVYDALASAAATHRQSLSAYVVDRLSEVAETTRLGDYLASYPPPLATGVTLEDAVAAVRDVREAS